MSDVPLTPGPQGVEGADVGFRDFAMRKHRSLWGDAWQRLASSATGRVGLALVAFLVLGAALSHFFWEYNPKTDLDYGLKLKPPNLTANEEVDSIHPFGTDKLGRDIFRRVVHGGWNSLRVGLVAVGISLVAGGLLGLMAGFYESMPLGPIGKVILFAATALGFGATVAWLSRQTYQVLLFLLLAGAALYWEDLWRGKTQRTVVFGLAGLLLGGLPGLLVGPLVALVCGLVGLVGGLVLAMPLSGNLVSNVIMRVMDIILAFPGILLAIAIVAMLGPGLDKGMIAIGFVGIPVYARLVRASVLSVIQEEYVTAGLAVGVGQGRILFRHIVPNTLSPIIVQSTMGLASAILWAGALGFLGLGAIPPEPEWGAMLGDSYKYLTSGAWWAVTFPGLAIMLSVLGFNLLGDGLRDALDPRLRI